MAKTLKKFKLVRNAANLVSHKLRFGPDNVPECCGERCPHHDGKRCALTGDEPERVCRPACSTMIRVLMGLDKIILG